MSEFSINGEIIVYFSDTGIYEEVQLGQKEINDFSLSLYKEFTMYNIWRHKKTGGLYVIIDEDAVIEKTLEKATIYRSLHDNRTWIRPHSEFHDGRFEVLNSMECKGEGKIELSHSDAF